VNIIKNIKDAKKVLGDAFSPNTGGKYVGIEIEMVSPISRDLLAIALVNEKLDSYVTIGFDESIDTEDYDSDEYDDGNYGLELRVLCLQSELKGVVTKLTALMKELDCFVNHTCGLHIHLDMRNRDSMQCYTKLAAAQGLLYSVVSTNRRESSYCKPTLYGEYARYVGSKEMPWSRNGINVRSLLEHNTIEIRIHEGTLDAKEIINFTRLLINIIDRKEAVNGWRLLKNKGLPTTSINYINKRIKLYGKAKLHKKNYVGA